MKFGKLFFTLPGAVILLLSSFASIANAQFQPPAQALVPCQQNPFSGCTVFAAFDQNKGGAWTDSNGLGKDPVFEYINGVLQASGLTNSNTPTTGLWTGVVPVSVTVYYLGGAGDNSTGHGTCNKISNPGSAVVATSYFPNNHVYTFGAAYSCTN